MSVVVVKIFSAVYVPILARQLGPAGLGFYNLALTMLPWFVTLISLSLATLVAQLVAEHRREKDELATVITTCIVFAMMLSLLGALLHFLAAKFIAMHFFHSAELLPYLQVASFGIATAILYNTILGVARGLKDFKLYFQMETMKSFMLVTLGLIFLLALQYRVKGALVAIILSPLVPIFHLVIKYKKYLKNRIQISLMLKNMKFGIWMTIISFFLTVMLTIDKFLLGMFSDAKTVGLYAAVGAIITAISLIPSSFKGSVLPFISENFTDKGTIRLTMQKIVYYALMLVGTVLLGLVAFRKEIILLVFGREFLPSASILPVLAITLLPFTIYIIMHTVIVDRRIVVTATKQLIPITITALLIDTILVKKFSAIGAGLGLLLSHSLNAVISIRLLH